MTDSKQTLELLIQKRDFVTHILNATKSTSFAGTEEDAVAYIDLMDERQSLFDQIIALDNELQSPEHQNILAAADADLLKQIEDITENIKRESQAIIALDQANQPIVEQIKAKLSAQIKDVRQGKNLNNMYQATVPHSTGQFDTSK